ncbi:MAG: homoserine kinase, partial [Chloroflexi bacterium]
MPLSFTLQIPASTANLGAGFDCLGLALNLYNLVRVEPAPGLRVSIEGEGGDTLARSVNNRVVRAMQLGCAAMDKPLPQVSLQMTNYIPLARGLGSSAAAAVGGLLAA